MAGNPYPQQGYGQQPIGQEQQMHGQQGLPPLEGAPMNYKEEFDNIGKGGVFFKLEPMKGYIVEFASEGKTRNATFTEATGETKEVVKGAWYVRIVEDKTGIYKPGDVVIWDISHAKKYTEDSLYGKIQYLIGKRGGTAIGLKIHVAKDTTGKRPDYRIPEYEQLKSNEMFESPAQGQAAPRQAPVQPPQAQVPSGISNPAGLPPEAFR